MKLRLDIDDEILYLDHVIRNQPKHSMKVVKRKAPNPVWDSVVYECERTGITISESSLVTDPDWMSYHINDGGNNISITEEVFEVMKKLLI